MYVCMYVCIYVCTWYGITARTPLHALMPSSSLGCAIICLETFDNQRFARLTTQKKSHALAAARGPHGLRGENPPSEAAVYSRGTSPLAPVRHGQRRGAWVALTDTVALGW